MPQCDKCSRDFATEEGLRQHNTDKHGIGKISKHEMREQKRLEKEKQKTTESEKRERSKMMKYAGVAAIAAVLIIGLWFFLQSMPKQSASQYDVSAFPSSFVHWHADVDVLICGEEKTLPEAAPGGLLGTNKLHTHDKAANIASLPGSDGNGVIHTEGNVRAAPQDHTLQNFMRGIGVKFDNETVMDKKNGDLCGTAAGTVKVFVNDQQTDNFLNYLPKDRDFIRIEFS